MFNFKLSEKHGVDWALASDIGAGPYMSMFDVMRSFISQNEKAGVKGATETKALFRSTLKGAEILELDDNYGSIEEGKVCDLVVLNSPRGHKDMTAKEILRKIIFRCASKRKEYDNLPVSVLINGEVV